MKAIVMESLAGRNQLQLRNLPRPRIQSGEVLVQVKALSINPVDHKTLQGKGQYENIKNDPPLILGWDIAGVVVESTATAFKMGDEVFGMINFPGHGKAYAEYVAAPAEHLALKPTSVSFEIAAGTALSALTAYQAIRKAAVKAGERVFLQGAAGGVGFFVVQMAKALGAYVIGTAKTEDEAILKARGLDEWINYQTTDFEQATQDIDFALDTLGAEAAVKALHILKPTGRLITIRVERGKAGKRRLKYGAYRRIFCSSIPAAKTCRYSLIIWPKD
ncbi:oxidoreductase [Siphonobacter sp. BAB-5405]|nr:NADP-dependent oxidoreductase [Siphonobacter sp. BAB-5405]PMD88754.1 oxidoreductase [Siphonobacter sp. BAB-5405]